MLSSRERFWRTVRFEPVDRLPFWADWLGPVERWKREGLPIDVDLADGAGIRRWFADFFGFDGMYSAFWGTSRVPVNIGVCPGLKEDTLEESDTYRIYRNGSGVVVKQFKDIPGSLHPTQFLEYPIKTHRDWRRFRDQHLDPGAPGRYPDDVAWEDMVRQWRERDYVITLDGGSFYGFLRDWIGVENLSVMFYDDPGMLHEMVDYLAGFYTQVLHKALHEVDVDFAMFWEDMCYKTGPLISPAMFREYILPGYRQVTAFLIEHGVELSWVDCDGNIEALIPLWIEGGVRGFYPLEVAADMDAGKLRHQYGQEIVMWGNVDKRALAQGQTAIDAEISRLAPVVESGGFIPLVDHGVPDDVPYENYLYYLEQRKQMAGQGL
jgi:uroporphyrinogen decarboxylase